jgi:hypothetical protein
MSEPLLDELPLLPPAAPPPRRESPLLVRSPILAFLVAALCGWLLWELAPDAQYALSSRTPVDLGGPGAHGFERARENRLVQVRGELTDAVPVIVDRTGQARTVGRLAGTNLLVDRPGRGGPPIYEGRLVPARSRAEYAPVVSAIRARGSPLGDTWLVLRDGDRPGDRWLSVAGSALLFLLLAVNLRALVKSLFD